MNDSCSVFHVVLPSTSVIGRTVAVDIVTVAVAGGVLDIAFVAIAIRVYDCALNKIVVFELSIESGSVGQF